MKKLGAIVIASLLFCYGFAQPLTGTKTIKVTGGDYSSFTTAITALNTYGVGTGGVTFNVDAGFIDSASNLVISDSTANSSNRIVFQKAGNGNNPLIIAREGTGNMDGIIKLVGVRYITFDKIDLIENSSNATSTTRMEWGYALLKPSAKRGCTNVIIKNCHITLNNSQLFNTNATYGIYSANHTIASSTNLVLSDTSACNSRNRFYSNSISNVYGGIYISGSTQPIYDQENMIGVEGANYITNFKGTGTANEAAIFAGYQNNLIIANNNINGGVNSNTPIYGIYTTGGTNSNIDIYNNNITLSSSATGGNGSMGGIINSIGSSGSSNTVKIYNNRIQNCKYSGTGNLIFNGITNNSSTYVLSIYNNIVNNDTIGGTGSFTGIYTVACNFIYINSNSIFNNRKSGNNGNMTCLSLNSGNLLNCYANLIHDNSIAGGSGSLYGYFNSSSTAKNENAYNTKVYNLIHSGTGNVYGFYSSTASASLKQIYNDTIYSLSTAGGSAYGFYTSNGADIRIYKNQVYNITSTTSTGTVYGIFANSGTAVYIYNNFISDLKTPASTRTSAVNGLYINGGTNVYVAYNSVFLNASSSSSGSFGSAAIFSSTNPTLELRNNIFVNNSTSGLTGGKTSAYQRLNSSLTSYSNLSNNNCFYAGAPSSRNVIFYDNTNFDSTITLFKSRVYSRDMNSFSENPPFINKTTAPYDLHLSSSIPTACESGGFPFSSPFSIPFDIDSNTRNTNFPDVGADEGNFTMIDQMQPGCTYTPFINTALFLARQLTATIIDPSGVPTTGNGLPVLYWKKNNTGSWNNAQATFSGSNDKFNFSFGSGVIIGDTIFYYIAAQDNATVPNIGVYPSPGASGFSSNPPAASTPPTNPDYYVIVPGFPGGNYRVGGTGSTPAAGCAYVDLTAALADISGREIVGAINLILTKKYSSSEENTFPLVIKYVQGQDATNTITIKPDTNVITSIARSSTTSVFKFDGAKYFIIDGSNNGTNSRDLTITNTNASSNTATIWIGSQGVGKGSAYVKVKNCNLNNGSTANNYGIFIGSSTAISTSTGGADNDYITLDNNQITKCNTGIYVIGTPIGKADFLMISNNTIGSSIASNMIGSNGIYLNSNVSNSTIIQNEIFGIIATYGSPIGIFAGNGVTNSNFSKNKIHDIASTIIGTAYGIEIGSGAGPNLVFDNNVISGIISIYNGYGIYVPQGSGYSFYFNSVFMSGDRDALGSNKPTTASYAFYSYYNASSLTLKDNVFVNTQLAASNPTTAKSYAIYNYGTSTTYSAINYNDYFVSGAQGVLGYQGTDITTLSGWKTATTGDLNSISADPQFNSASNLIPGPVSPVLAAGTPITGITTDISGITRNVTKPSIGAYETGSDVTGPIINYTAFSNTSSTTARTLTATITDPSGVPTSGAGLPVLYWKKKKAGAWTSVTATSIGSDQYTFTFGSGVTVGDTVFYYIAAQDKYSTVNVSVYPSTNASGFTSNPPAITIPPSNSSSYFILGSISAGNYDIGGSGTTHCGTCTYVDLTAAFNDISPKEITGAISLRLTSSYKSTEEDAFPITINPIAGASATNTITIKPAFGITDTIAGNSTSSILRLYGADYITIDGSNNGTTSRDLVIQNTSTTTGRATIQISSRGVNNGATFNTIKNTIIMAGNSTATNYGISIGNTVGGSGDDNDNISLINNWFLRVNYGIFSSGTTGGMQDNLTISNNIFGDTALVNSIGRYGIYIMNNTGANISNNTISNIKSTGSDPAGIYLGGVVTQSKVISNLINGVIYSNPSPTGGGKGIDISIGMASNLLIANNMITGISGNGTGNLSSYAIVGIRIQFSSGGINLYHNTVNLYGKIAHTGTTANKNAALFISSSASALDIRNNIFSNSILDTNGTNTSYAIYSDAATTAFTNLNYNNYFVSNKQGVIGCFNFVDDTTFTAWKTASGKDSNSFNVNPVYVSDVDLHVSSVYLNDTGDTISKITDDFDGDARNAGHPDIGADEFNLKAVATTLWSDQILGSKATVWGKVNPMNEYNTVVSFEYGTTTAYGLSATAVQSPVQGMKDTSVKANLTGLLPQTTYHYRIVATTSAGITYGKDSTLKTTVGIQENQVVKDAIIFMNGKNLIVELKSDISDAQIMVYDLFGKEIFIGKMKGKQIQLDLGNSATGYYLVSIISDQTVLNKKVFVK